MAKRLSKPGGYTHGVEFKKQKKHVDVLIKTTSTSFKQRRRGLKWQNVCQNPGVHPRGGI